MFYITPHFRISEVRVGFIDNYVKKITKILYFFTNFNLKLKIFIVKI